MALVNPISFISSLSEAELKCHAIICQATGSVSGIQAYVGALPNNVYNKSGFGLTIPIEQEAPFYSQCDIKVCCWAGFGECVFVQRHHCQNWQMQILKSLPICRDGNLVEFKVDGIGQIQPLIVEAANEGAIQCWRATMQFQIIFSTGGKDN